MGNLPCSILILCGLFFLILHAPRRLFCLYKYTIAECPVIDYNSVLFVRASPDAVLLLLLGWLVCSLLAANDLM